MNKIVWTGIVLFLFSLTSFIAFAPANPRIEFELNVSKDVNVTFGGRLYQLLYQPTMNYKCLSNGVFNSSLCYILPKNVTLNKDLIIDITSATYIVIDRSYYVQQGNKVYQINYIQRNITNCICEIPTGCLIRKCVQ